MAKSKATDFVDNPIDDDSVDLDAFGAELEQALEGELLEAEVDDLSAPLTVDDARQLTDTIRNAAEMLWMLIARAHAGRAWEALGFASWEAYVREEFDMSRSRSYQILDQARVIAAIAGSTPEGTPVAISEAAARDLKGVLDEVLPEVRERTEGLAPDEASIVLDEIVEEQRDRLREQRNAEAEADADDDSFEEYGGKGNGNYRGGDDFPEDDADAIYDDVDNIDTVSIRRNVNAAHDIYSSLAALASLPDELDDVLAIIPEERHGQINGNLAKAERALKTFAELWRASDYNDRGDDEI